jgi:hypothetical protein
MIKPPINQASGDGAGGKDASSHEGPTIKVDPGVGYFTGGYFVRLFQRIDNWLNDEEE